MVARNVNVSDGQNKRMLKIADLCEYVSMGMTSARIWGKEIGAERRIGRSVFYDRKVVDQALDELKND